MNLLLFTTDAALAVGAVRAGVSHIIVDWERASKGARQSGTGFQVSSDTVHDVEHLSRGFDLPVLVRVNPVGPGSHAEIQRAVDAGAQGLMLPMARSAAEVDAFLRLVPVGLRTLIQIETAELAARPQSLRDLPWDYVHVGLNDLMLARSAPSIWSAVLDGTVERIAELLAGRAFGFGGLTVVDGGRPIPSRLVMLEMVRLGCSVGVLRRSFVRDVVGRDLGAEISAIRRLLSDGAGRSPRALRNDRAELEAAIMAAGG